MGETTRFDPSTPASGDAVASTPVSGTTLALTGPGPGAAHPSAPADPPLAPGTLLDGRYRIQALLGTGGMGTVYRAEHVGLGRLVAVKLLHPELCDSEAERKRFRHEALVAVRLRSPHVVEVLDFGDDGDRMFLAMELLEGEPLRALLAREGRLSPERTVRLLRQLLSGLDAAHAAGIVHRDLKPENLWLSGSGADERLRILDFGIAKWAGRPDAARTQSGLVVGTPEYLAPEQAVGGEVDHRADLYSAGVLAFVCLTGRHPFATEDVRRLLAAHAYQAVPCPAALAPELAAWPRLLDVVARATAKDRELRPGSARALLELLEGAEVPVRPSPAPAPARPRGGAPGPRPTARATLLGVPAAATPEGVNLTLVRLEIAGWAGFAAVQPPDARARRLAVHDALALPAVHAFGGRRLEAEDGAATFAFRSPTDAVHCAAAVQDLAASLPVEPEGAPRLELRAAVHQGEIRVSAAGASGTPLAISRALAEAAAPGEIWLTRTVWLTMNRSEAPAEEMGPRLLPGAEEPLVVYRVARVRGGEPYGGRHASRLRRRAGGGLLEPVATGLASIQVAGATEGKARATGRVVAAAAALAANGVVAAGATGLHSVLRGALAVTGRGRPLRPSARRLLAALDRARAAARARAPWLGLALRRPEARRRRGTP